MFLDHIERYSASVGASERGNPDAANALAAIAGDQPARERYLEFARDADEPAVRARMLEVARNLGWVTPDEAAAEIVRMLEERVARDNVGVSEVNLVCGRAGATPTRPGPASLRRPNRQGATSRTRRCSPASAEPPPTARRC